MNLDNCDSQATEKKLSEQFAEFIDLADEDLEEVNVLEFGGIRGGLCGGCGCGGCGCFHCGGCGCFHCGGCGCFHCGGCGCPCGGC